VHTLTYSQDSPDYQESRGRKVYSDSMHNEEISGVPCSPMLGFPFTINLKQTTAMPQ